MALCPQVLFQENLHNRSHQKWSLLANKETQVQAKAINKAQQQQLFHFKMAPNQLNYWLLTIGEQGQQPVVTTTDDLPHQFNQQI